MELVYGFLGGALLALVVSFVLIKLLLKVQADKFQLMASELLEKNSNTLNDKANQNFSNILIPLNEKIKEYKDYLDHMHKYDLKDRESLREKMNQMISSADKIEAEASQLSQVLSSDVKFQGDWGELVLERVLEMAGLNEGTEYSLQEVLTDEGGSKYRPDAVIKLPNSSHIIIDSKVSLKSYFDYINSSEKEKALKELKLSIQTHIDQLSKKDYHHLNGVNAPDFTYLFIPVEGVYSLVIREFPKLIDDSLKKNIVLVSPVNLIANLKTVGALWRLENQSKNAEEIAKKAGAMYDKFSFFINDLDKVGDALHKAVSTYDEAYKKLATGNGNLIKRSEELKEMGAQTTKTLS